MRNMLLRLCLLALLPLHLTAQAIYTGQVQDVATRRTVAGVQVELLNSYQAPTTSNVSGDFLVKNDAVNSIDNDLNVYQFYNNSMIWEGDKSISLELYMMDGRAVVQAVNLGESGTYLFPRLPVGVYVLRVTAEDEWQTFKAFSDGVRTSIADREAVWYQSSVPEQADTLRFSKPGYYDRLIPLRGRDTLLRVNLLKKENEELHYLNELIDPVAYDLLSSLPSRSNDGQVRSVKIIHNLDDDRMYYMNTKRYELHYIFATAQLDFKQGNAVFNQTQYRSNPDRYLYPASVNYYASLDKYVLYLVSGNEMSCEEIKLLYEKIVATSYLEGKLFLLANRPEFNACEIPIITTEELYEGQNYQALNLAENYGYLRKVEVNALEDTYLGRHDIPLLNGVPNDVSVVAGIITTEFQTPLSHINVLSHNRNTPNMALRDGWDNPRLQSLLGQLVYLRVQSDSFEIRPATLSEANQFWATNEPQTVINLDADLTTQGLVDLYAADYADVKLMGGKAANFAEILNVTVDGLPIPTPEGPAFGIPFYYYDQHIKAAGLEFFIEDMLQNELFLSDPAIRKARLEDLQDRIKDHPLDPELVALVEAQIDNFAQFPAFRFRSSTNAEDLEDFSGAGLYSSYSAKQDNPSKTVERAIRKVWASLWNWRAFEERSYYKINHLTCAMGILVHRSFPDEDANGVVITKNLYNFNPGFIINVQHKEHSIVFPEPGVLHDQIMLFTWSNIPGQQFMPEYLTFSNIPELNGETVLTNEELQELGTYCMALKRHFYQNVPHDCNCTEQNFGLDIEFKVDSQVGERKIYIKQARLYK